jgi:hypothetical protein
MEAKNTTTNATHIHTPGPWKAVPDPTEQGSLMIVGSDFPAMGVVARVDVYRHNEAGESDSDANARLIAAAPALLAALEEARASFGRALDHMTCRDDDPLDLACDCDFHAVLRSIETIRLAANLARGA